MKDKRTPEHLKAEAFYQAAAKAYADANNGRLSAADIAKYEDRVNMLHVAAIRELVKVHGPGIEVSFPGLYPCFRLGSREYMNILDLAQYAPRVVGDES